MVGREELDGVEILSFVDDNTYPVDLWIDKVGTQEMEKKYQIFISSTYRDLIEAREKVRDAILTMMQFPIGMEMFSAADEEQWEII